MDFFAAATHLAAFAAGIATDWVRQLGASHLAKQKIRRAIAAEVQGILVHLNFFIAAAMDQPETQGRSLLDRYFAQPLRLQSFEYYWTEQRAGLLDLPEWPRLRNWVGALASIHTHESPLLAAIMVFETLTIPPLDRCLTRDSRKFVHSVLNRPEVAEYKTRYFYQKAGLR